MFNASSQPIEMGYTIIEFSKVLHGNFSGEHSEYSCQDISPSSWVICNDQSDLKTRIDVEQKPPRSLGLLNLPVLGVSFHLIAGNTEDQQLFFDKFFRYFHKGGG
jgi:hypothetical protein